MDIKVDFVAVVALSGRKEVEMVQQVNVWWTCQRDVVVVINI
jgi:hypothetical protein